MSHAKDPAVYVWDMLYEIELVERHAVGDWTNDPMVSRAVLRCFTILGEAAKRIDEPTRNRATHIPWQKIIDTRNFLSHEYEEINLKKTDDIIRQHFPTLKSDLSILYKQLTGNDYHAD